MFDTIIYHKDCPDGFCAAYIAQKKYPSAVIIPVAHGENLNTVMVLTQIKGRHVLVVDFSWRRETTEHLHKIAASMTILDHHKSAEAELAGLDYCTFDVSRSGAQLAWDYCFPDTPRPWFVEYVADRDLWTWKLPNSKSVSAYIMTVPYTKAAWDSLAHMHVAEVLERGLGAEAHVAHYVEKVTAQAYPGMWPVIVDDLWNYQLKLSIVNAAYPNISDVCHELCVRGAEVGVGWFRRADGLIQFSLRSIGDLDVSLLAKMHGGGGHRNAAGFQLPIDQALKVITEWTA